MQIIYTSKSPVIKKVVTIFVITCFLFSCTKSTDEDKYYILNGLILDYDSQAPIFGAKVFANTFCNPYCQTTKDSALTDAAGRVLFRYRLDERYAILQASKANYLNQSEYWNFAYINIDSTKTDTLYLAKPSFINVTAHKTGAYLPLDTIKLEVNGDNTAPYGETALNIFRIMYKGKADAIDRVFNLQAVYSNHPGDLPYRNRKVYFIKTIIRNGSAISSQTDSTNIIQFGTQNFTLNY